MSEQLNIYQLLAGLQKLAAKPKPDKFDGATYDAKEDGARLTTLMGRVYSLMADGKWRTLAEVSKACGGSEASVSARLRDLRKSKFQKRYPASDVERLRVDGGLYRYRVKL